MKRSSFLLFIMTALAAFSSCSNMLYKHQQALASCRTRGDVSRRFGRPDEDIHTVTAEEWVYGLDKHRDTVKTALTDSSHAVKVMNYEKYLKFTFDLQGNITGHESNVADPVKALVSRFQHVTPIRIVAGTLFLAIVVYIVATTKHQLWF